MTSYFKESRYLEVLDLHNNHITNIDLYGLTGLKLLNLEGNCIINATNFADISCLVDLNLKRNKASIIDNTSRMYLIDSV